MSGFYGVTFKSLHSYNNFKLTMLSDNRNLLGDVTRQTKFVPGLGLVDFGNDTYQEKPLTVKFHYCAATPEDLAAQMELIGGWLYDDGQFHDLIFDDSPSRKYRVKVLKAVPLNQEDLIGEITVEFTCNPAHPLGLDNQPITPADIQKQLLWDTASLEGTQYLQEFSAAGNMDFTVNGNYPVKPRIGLFGNVPAGLKLTYGSQNWQYDPALLNDGILIDCAAETVTKMSDGTNLFDGVNFSYDDFFVLSPGQNRIVVTATGLSTWPSSLYIFIEFTPIF